MEPRDAAQLVEEERNRAEVYSLLATLLARAPGEEQLCLIAKGGGGLGDFGAVIDALAAAAQEASVTSVSREYHDLFIGMGRGELVPYASYYLTGFLNEKPLANLRADLRALGIERDPSVKEPEDHMAVLLEVMAGLITGRFGEGDGLAGQRRFFENHIAPWARHFFRDLETASSARFYAPLGRMGRLLIEVEEAAFAMA